MQYQKVEIRARILNAGKAEFLSKGYRAGKISTITKNAGVAVGNLYKYFDGKNGLLDAIVSEPYEIVPKQIASIVESHSNKSDIIELATVLTEEFKKIYNKYSDEILILWDKCQGSKYEDFRKKLHSLVCDNIEKFVLSGKDKETQLFCCLISEAFLNMIFQILKKDPQEIKHDELIKKLIIFYFYNIEKRI